MNNNRSRQFSQKELLDAQRQRDRVAARGYEMEAAKLYGCTGVLYALIFESVTNMCAVAGGRVVSGSAISLVMSACVR